MFFSVVIVIYVFFGLKSFCIDYLGDFILLLLCRAEESIEMKLDEILDLLR